MQVKNPRAYVTSERILRHPEQRIDTKEEARNSLFLGLVVSAANDIR